MVNGKCYIEGFNDRNFKCNAHRATQHSLHILNSSLVTRHEICTILAQEKKLFAIWTGAAAMGIALAVQLAAHTTWKLLT